MEIPRRELPDENEARAHSSRWLSPIISVTFFTSQVLFQALEILLIHSVRCPLFSLSITELFSLSSRLFVVSILSIVFFSP